jgi:protein-S-isoprenylcysteine O-methyltransferase Ste14
VPLGFLLAAVAFWAAQPTAASVWMGMSISALGELLRIWAAGHIEKGREVTRSGPYRWIRHPLYLGSTVMGLGFVVSSRSWIAGLLVGAYLVVTLIAAMRVEEARLDVRFDGAYAAYRAGQAPPQLRRFSVARAIANREYRAMAGFVLAIALLVLRIRS